METFGYTDVNKVAYANNTDSVSNLPLASALPADEVAFWKWQEHAVYSRIIFGAVHELGLEAGGSHVIDDEQSARTRRGTAFS